MTGSELWVETPLHHNLLFLADEKATTDAILAKAEFSCDPSAASSRGVN
jgi:hypothetical protein